MSRSALDDIIEFIDPMHPKDFWRKRNGKEQIKQLMLVLAEQAAAEALKKGHEDGPTVMAFIRIVGEL